MPGIFNPGIGFGAASVYNRYCVLFIVNSGIFKSPVFVVSTILNYLYIVLKVF